MKLSKRLLSKTVAIAAVCATMATAAFAAPQGTFDTSEIQITGEASRSVAPNYAILTLGITSENTNINAAKSNNDRIMSDLISKLGHLGIDKKDIYTSNISINPTSDYQDGKRINTGYSVANRVTVKINKMCIRDSSRILGVRRCGWPYVASLHVHLTLRTKRCSESVVASLLHLLLPCLPGTLGG